MSDIQKTSVLFVRDKLRLYGTAAALNEKTFVYKITNIQDKAMQLKDRRQKMLFFAQCRKDLQKQGYLILECFPGTCEFYERCYMS